jgi:hypothetical protein
MKCFINKLFTLFLLLTSFAISNEPSSSNTPTSNGRKKEIVLDENTIEGFDKRSGTFGLLGGASHTSSSNTLYNSDKDFEPDNKKSLRELGFLP